MIHKLMKLKCERFLIVIFTIFFFNLLNSQVVLNEVSVSPKDVVVSGQTIKLDGSFIGKDLDLNGSGTTEPCAGEWIELYNNSCVAVDVSGYYIGTFNSDDGYGMSFKIPSGKIIPPKGFAIIRGENSPTPISRPNLVDIVAIETSISDYCIELPFSGSNKRMWFKNSSGWVGLYNSSGTALDALSWGAILSSTNQSGQPCNPSNPLSFLPSYSSFSSSNRKHFSFSLNLDGSPIKGNTFVRIPDGGAWSNTFASETSTFGSNNEPITLDPTPTLSDVCTGAATTTLTYIATPTRPTDYKITWDATPAGLTSDANFISLPTTGTTLAINIPTTLSSNTYNGTIQFQYPGCIIVSKPISLIVKSTPSVSGTNTLCEGTTTADWTPISGVTWTSSDPTIATVATGGTLSGLKKGTVTITATANNCSADRSVTIKPKPVLDPLVNLNKCVDDININLPVAIAATSDPSLLPCTYKWRELNGVASTDLPNATPYSAITSDNLVISTATAALDGKKYNCLVTGSNGCSVSSTDAILTVKPILKPQINSKSTTLTSVTFEWPNLVGLNAIPPSIEDAYEIEEYKGVPPITYGLKTGSLNYNVATSKWEYSVTGLTTGSTVYIKVTPQDGGTLAVPSCFGSSTFDLTASSCVVPTIVKDIDLKPDNSAAQTSFCIGTTPVSAEFQLDYNNAASITWQEEITSGNWTDITSAMSNYLIDNALPNISKFKIIDVALLNGRKYRAKLNSASGACDKLSTEITLVVKPTPVFLTTLKDEFFYCPSTTVNDPVSPSTTNDIKLTIAQSGNPTYTWTNSSTSIGLDADNGVNPVSSLKTFSTTNSTNSDIVSTLKVIPTLNGCLGLEKQFKITVKPIIKPIFGISDLTQNSVKFKWTSTSLTPPDLWKIDTSIVSSTVITPPTPSQYKNVTPSISGTTLDYTVSGVNSSKKVYLRVTPQNLSTNTTLLCPEMDELFAIPLPCVNPIVPATPIFSPICEGEPLEVDGGTLDPLADIQWKISTNAGVTWNNVSTTDFGTTGNEEILEAPITKTYMKDALVKVELSDKLSSQCIVESTPITLEINPLPTVKLIQPAKNSLCVDESEVSATVQPLIGTSPMKVDYTFNGTTSTDQDISTFDIKFATSAETNYLLSIDKVTDANGCVSLLTGLVSTVVVNKNPTPDFTVSDTIGCLPLTVNFIDISGETYKDVTWDFGTGVNSSKDQGTTTFKYQKEGDYTVTYSVEDAIGCKSENIKVDKIHVKSPPKASISSDRNLINIYENVVRFDSKLSQNATFYKWDFGDNSSISNEPVVNHKYDPNSPGKFKVYLIVSNSPTNMTCSDTATTWIDFPEEVIYYIPNSFTPNGDEFNNTFQPIFSSGYDPQNYSFIIFDRWGQIVFESENPYVGWDGTFGDKVLGNDTFVWKLGFKEKANDNEHYVTGHVNLVK